MGKQNPDQLYHRLEVKEKSSEEAPSDTVEIKKLVEGFMTDFTSFKTKMDDQWKEVMSKKGKSEGDDDVVRRDEITKLNAALDEQKGLVDKLRLDLKRTPRDTTAGVPYTDDQIAHKSAFNTYFRKGRGEDELRSLEAKALSVGTDPDGGYTVPVQMEAGIDRVITEVSPIRSIARTVQVSTASYKKIINMGGATSGWVGETGARGDTETPTLEVLEFPVMELYAQPAATQSLLDDSVVNIEQWLADEVSLEFAVQEGQAFINGNGSAKPRGFLAAPQVEEDSWAWGSLGYRATGVSGDWADSSGDPGAEQDNLIDLVYSLKPVFRGNARFVMNRKTQAAIRKLRDADGQMLWYPDMRTGQPATLLGYAITEAEDMPDIAADAVPIAFGDFNRGYTVIDRIGIRTLRDPYTAKPYIKFYTTKRVGGGVSHFDAIKLLKFGTS